MKDRWNDFQKRWHLLDAPLRPARDAVDVIVAAVGEQPSNVLVLGVTPELVERFEHLTAVDKSEEMIGALWHPSKSTTPRSYRAPHSFLRSCAGSTRSTLR